MSNPASNGNDKYIEYSIDQGKSSEEPTARTAAEELQRTAGESASTTQNDEFAEPRQRLPHDNSIPATPARNRAYWFPEPRIGDGLVGSSSSFPLFRPAAASRSWVNYVNVDMPHFCHEWDRIESEYKEKSGEGEVVDEEPSRTGIQQHIFLQSLRDVRRWTPPPTPRASNPTQSPAGKTPWEPP